MKGGSRLRGVDGLERAEVGREKVGDSVVDGVGLGAFGALEGAGDDSVAAFFFDGEVERALALGAGEDVHDFFSHLSKL